MSTATSEPVDVAIVGYGPVGSALAILLTQLGRTVTVLERWPEPYPLPRAVHFDHEVGRINSVTVTGADGTTISARYVVGCDGANSTVRTLTGLAVTDLGFFYDWLIVDVILDEPRVFDPLNLQICDPARPTTVVSGGPGRRRWEFMRLPHESLDELNDEARAWELLAPWDVHPANARLERHAVYTFNARYAEQWRAGRVLVATSLLADLRHHLAQGATT